MSAYSLTPIYGLATRIIACQGIVVGYLYASHYPGDTWEVWARHGYARTLLGRDDALSVKFATEADALAFLGLSCANERVAA